MERDAGGGSRRAGLIFGVLLVLGGLALLLAQVYGYELRLDVERLGWPAFILIPGLVLLVIGLALGDEPGVGLAVAGGIVSTVGLVLAYQQATGHYASWAYAWALVAPGAVGLSMVLWGVLHLRSGVIRSGLASLGVGLVLFLVFFAFFEGVLNIGGERGLAAYGRQALPYALILAGVLVVLGRLLPDSRPRPATAYWRPGMPPEPPPSPPLRVDTREQAEVRPLGDEERPGL
ncbi:MAG TPA: hypothetical protein VH741_01890 [Candidatus Limnocylindrales bacterium]